MITINDYIQIIRLYKANTYIDFCIAKTSNYTYNPLTNTLTRIDLAFYEFHDIEHIEHGKYLDRFTVKEYCGPDVVIKETQC